MSDMPWNSINSGPFDPNEYIERMRRLGDEFSVPNTANVGAEEASSVHREHLGPFAVQVAPLTPDLSGDSLLESARARVAAAIDAVPPLSRDQL